VTRTRTQKSFDTEQIFLFLNTLNSRPARLIDPWSSGVFIGLLKRQRRNAAV